MKLRDMAMGMLGAAYASGFWGTVFLRENDWSVVFPLLIVFGSIGLFGGLVTGVIDEDS